MKSNHADTNDPIVRIDATNCQSACMEENTPPSVRYWFQARRSRFLGARPVTWEGWCVVLAYVVSWIVGPIIFSPARQSAAFAMYLIGVSVLFMLVHELKSGPPR